MQVWKVLCAVCGLAAASQAAPVYTVTALGSFGGASTAFAINDSGLIAGTSANAAGDQRAFVWSNGAMTALGDVPLSYQQYGNAINASGAVAGGAIVPNASTPVIWENGQAAPLTDLAGMAMGINDLGDIAGSLTVDGSGHIFRTRDGAVQDLGTLGGSWASAYGINDAGDLAGYGISATGQMRGFVYLDGQMITVGTLGGTASYAMAINDSGLVTGHAETASGAMQAYAWQNGVLTALGTLGGYASYGYGLNEAGDIVGTSWLTGNAAQAAYLYRDGAMTDLNSLIDPASGWWLDAAYDINASGQIVGSGTYQGQQMAFVLTPTAVAPPVLSVPASAVPEPGTASLFSIAGIALIAGSLLSRRRQL